MIAGRTRHHCRNFRWSKNGFLLHLRFKCYNAHLNVKPGCLHLCQDDLNDCIRHA